MKMAAENAGKEDRRSIRTKKMIRTALFDLLEKKNFHDITISDITEMADINRGTFYLHYEDKFDLLNKIEDEALDQIIQYAKEVDFSEVFQFDERGMIREIIKPIPFIQMIIDFFKENRALAMAILGKNGDPRFVMKLKNTMVDAVFRDQYILRIDEAKMLVPKEIFVTYIMSAHLGVLTQWIDEGMKRSPEELALIMTKIFVYGPMRVTGIVPGEALHMRKEH